MFCPKCGKELPSDATFCPSCGTPVQAAAPGAAPSAPASGIDTLTRDRKAQEYWVERLIAFIIDAVIIDVVVFVLVAVVSVPLLLAGAFTPFAFAFGLESWLSGLILVLYFTFMESSSGASFGKRIFHLKAVNKAGSNPTFSEALIRNVSKINGVLLLLDVIVGLAITKDYHQKYSDHFIGTTVVRS